VKALARTLKEHCVDASLLDAVESINDVQKGAVTRALSGIIPQSDWSGMRVAIWGLAFKPGTDDMREAPSLRVIEELLRGGAIVTAHDPVAGTEAHRILGDTVDFAIDPYDAVSGANALLVLTEWPEYRDPDFARIRNAMNTPVIVDGRNLYAPSKVLAAEFIYRSIGRPFASGRGVVAGHGAADVEALLAR
jgi:UDPglucose 6-dehydrogenase